MLNHVCIFLAWSHVNEAWEDLFKNEIANLEGLAPDLGVVILGTRFQYVDALRSASSCFSSIMSRDSSRSSSFILGLQ